MLQSNTVLSVLSLNDNYVGPKGATVLATALRSNSAVRAIMLRQHQLDSLGVIALC